MIGAKDIRLALTLDGQATQARALRSLAHPAMRFDELCGQLCAMVGEGWPEVIDPVQGALHEVRRLLARAALAVDGGGGNLEREPGCKPSRTADVAGLGTDGVEAADHRVVDHGRIEARAVEDLLQHMRAEVGRVLRPGGTFALTFSNRCFPTKAIRGWLEKFLRRFFAFGAPFIVSTPFVIAVGIIVLNFALTQIYTTYFPMRVG